MKSAKFEVGSKDFDNLPINASNYFLSPNLQRRNFHRLNLVNFASSGIPTKDLKDASKSNSLRNASANKNRLRTGSSSNLFRDLPTNNSSSLYFMKSNLTQTLLRLNRPPRTAGLSSILPPPHPPHLPHQKLSNNTNKSKSKSAKVLPKSNQTISNNNNGKKSSTSINSNKSSNIHKNEPSNERELSVTKDDNGSGERSNFALIKVEKGVGGGGGDRVQVIRTEEERKRSPDSIRLDKCGLKQFPLIGASEGQLKLISLQHNLITRLENLPLLNHLVILDLYDNRLEKMIGLQGLLSLRVLLLGKNRIKRIEGLECVKRLEVLDLHGNQIRYVDNLNSLLNLRVLNLAGNLLRNIKNLGGQHELPSLNELNLKRNRIKTLDGIQKAPHLKKLLVSNNELSSYPNLISLKKLVFLQELCIESNPIVQTSEFEGQMLSLAPWLENLDKSPVTDQMRLQGKLWSQRRQFELEERQKEMLILKKQKTQNPSGSRDDIIYEARRRWESLKSLVNNNTSPSNDEVLREIVGEFGIGISIENEVCPVDSDLQKTLFGEELELENTKYHFQEIKAVAGAGLPDNSQFEIKDEAKPEEVENENINDENEESIKVIFENSLKLISKEDNNNNEELEENFCNKNNNNSQVREEIENVFVLANKIPPAIIGRSGATKIAIVRPLIRGMEENKQNSFLTSSSESIDEEENVDIHLESGIIIVENSTCENVLSDNEDCQKNSIKVNKSNSENEIGATEEKEGKVVMANNNNNKKENSMSNNVIEKSAEKTLLDNKDMTKQTKNLQAKRHLMLGRRSVSVSEDNHYQSIDQTLPSSKESICIGNLNINEFPQFKQTSILLPPLALALDLKASSTLTNKNEQSTHTPFNTNTTTPPISIANRNKKLFALKNLRSASLDLGSKMKNFSDEFGEEEEEDDDISSLGEEDDETSCSIPTSYVTESDASPRKNKSFRKNLIVQKNKRLKRGKSSRQATIMNNSKSPRINSGLDKRSQFKRSDSASNIETNGNSITLKRQGVDYLVEIDGKVLNLFGQGALKHTLMGFPTSATSSVTTVKFHYLQFDTIIPYFGKLRQIYPSLEHFQFRANNLKILSQLNTLSDLQGLTSLIISKEGNPIAENDIWISYASYRLAHWGLQTINGKEIASEYRGASLSSQFDSLGFLSLSCLPQSALTPLAKRLHTLHCFCCCSPSTSSDESTVQVGRKKTGAINNNNNSNGEIASTLNICNSWDEDPILLDVIGKEALVYTPPQDTNDTEEKGALLKEDILLSIIDSGCDILEKLEHLENVWPSILTELVSNILSEYIFMDNYMKNELKKLRDISLSHLSKK